eukprot:3736102-Prymnesium_polylepis.2
MDHAYYWPHFVGIEQPVAYGDDTIALFTLSKLTGHASSRIGWAITSNAALADAMERWIYNAGSVPRENQLRAIALLQHGLAHSGALFTYARHLMLTRWERLEAVFAASTTYRLEPRDADTSYTMLSDAPGTYPPSPAYAWVEKLDGGHAYAAMREAGIRGRDGVHSGAAARFVRLELLMREETFVLLLGKLAALVQS